MRRTILAIGSIGLLLYPLLVYQFASQDRPLLLAATLALLLSLRLFAMGTLTKPRLLLALLVVLSFCTLAQFDTQLRVLRLYPVLISLGGAGFCLYSLKHPPSAIERFARRMGMEVPDAAISYLRGVTTVWLAFFCLNAAVAAYTAVAANIGHWALYNGLISYLIIGLLLVGEWLYRRRYMRLQNS